MRKLTFLLLMLLLAATSFSLLRRSELLAGQKADKQDLRLDRLSKARAAFPTADIDEPNTDDSVKGRAIREKRKRYNTLKMVPSSVATWVAERVFTPEGLFNFPALPIKESDIILIAVVSNSTAHMSSDKRNVFSEFNLEIESVLKTSLEAIKEGSTLTVDRIGGYVKYPDGQRILYRVNGMNMPEVGSRYLFFLEAKKKPDFTVLTAYELTLQGISALDISSQFLELEGITETELKTRTRSLLKL